MISDKVVGGSGVNLSLRELLMIIVVKIGGGFCSADQNTKSRLNISRAIAWAGYIFLRNVKQKSNEIGRLNHSCNNSRSKDGTKHVPKE